MATQPHQAQAGTPQWFYEMVARSVSTGVFSLRVLLTPALAAELLRNNPNNRGQRVGKTAQLVSDIQADRWVFNGEPIIVSDDGQLNDGQHRCNAVVDSNRAIETMMTFGLPRTSRLTVDQGAARCAADYLSMDAIPNASLVASIGRMLIAWERSERRNFSGVSFISAGEVIKRYGADEQVARSAHFAAGVNNHAKRYAPPSVIGFCHAIFSRIDRAQADTFMRQVAVGESITKSNPAFAVRNGLSRDRLTRDEKTQIIIHGWNAFRQNRRLQLVKVLDTMPAVI